MDRLLTEQELRQILIEYYSDKWGKEAAVKFITETNPTLGFTQVATKAQDGKTRRLIFSQLKKYCQNEYERLSLHDLETLENEE